MKTYLIKRSLRHFGGAASKPGLIDPEHKNFTDKKLTHLSNTADDDIRNSMLKNIFNTRLIERFFN